jgi:hypothetical protein
LGGALSGVGAGAAVPGAWGAGVVTGAGGDIGPPTHSCQASNTATDRAIAISARFSMSLSI